MIEDLKVTSLGESITEVKVSSLVAQNNSTVNEGDILIEVESEKASVEIPAIFSGEVSYKVSVGDVLNIGDIFATIDTSKGGKKKVVESKKEVTPLVSSNIRVTPEDYLNSLLKKEEKKPEDRSATSKVADRVVERKEPVKDIELNVSREKMSKMRLIIARRMVESKNESAMLTTFNEVDMSEVIKARNSEKEAFRERHGVKLTYMPFFIKASTMALEEFKDINSFIDGDEIVVNRSINIGIAVSSDNGLVVPVIRDVQKMSFSNIAIALKSLADKSKQKLSIRDLSGGTFTITNGGVFGSMLSTPIINPPQSAILGMHNIVKRAVVVDDEIVIRPIMYLALSYDHRIVDGKESISFLMHIKKTLEQPVKFFID